MEHSFSKMRATCESEPRKHILPHLCIPREFPRVITLLLLTTAIAAPSVASTIAPVIDQSYSTPATGNTIIASRHETAQTFTVGLTGTITSIDVNIGRFTSASDPGTLTLDVRRTVNGIPVEENTGPNILASLTKPASAIHATTGFNTTFQSFDVPDFPVIFGDTLAIVMTTTSTDFLGFAWARDDPGSYTGGRSFARGTSATALTWGDGSSSSYANADYEFRTWVIPVPEASSALLTILGVMLATRRCERTGKGDAI